MLPERFLILVALETGNPSNSGFEHSHIMRSDVGFVVSRCSVCLMPVSRCRRGCWRGSGRRAGTSTRILKTTAGSSQKNWPSLFRKSEAIRSLQSDTHTHMHTWRHAHTLSYWAGAGRTGIEVIVCSNVANGGTKVNILEWNVCIVKWRSIFFYPFVSAKSFCKTLWNQKSLYTDPLIWCVTSE